MLGFAGSRAAVSVGVFGVYVTALGLTLVVIPGVPMALGGLPEPADVWVRVAGMMMFFMGCTEIIAGRTDWTAFIKASVPLRFTVIGFFAAFVAAGQALPALILFGLPDALSAAWTVWALRADRKERADAVAV